MAIHRVSAVFASRADAERVGRILVSEFHIPHAAVEVKPLGYEPPTTYDSSNLWDAAAMRPTGSFFLTGERRQLYLEELRRGRMQLSALVDGSDVAHATHLLEHSGALALYDDEHELKHEHDLQRQPSAMTSVSPATVSESSGAVHKGVVSIAEVRPTAVSETVRPRRSRVRSYPIEQP